MRAAVASNSRAPTFAALGAAGVSLLGGCAQQRSENNFASPARESAISISLTPVPGFAARYIGSWAPWTTPCSKEIPPSLRKVPPHSEDALFGEFSFGEGTRYKVQGQMVGFMLDEKRERFIADENRNGDLTDDRPAWWTAERSPSKDGTDTWGELTLRAEIATSQRYDAPAFNVAFFLTDAQTRAKFKEERVRFNRYRDYATEGALQLGTKVYRVLLDDGAVTGDFLATPEHPRSDLTFRIDVNQNGLYETKGEAFDADQPFTIEGVTYKIARISPDGRHLELVPSEQTVPEILPPPDLSVGKIFPTFSANTTSGAPVNFPSSFAGKIVLVDFWASWCGPCVREVPYLKEAYRNFHARGLEILSISIDEDKTREKARELIQAENLEWQQIFDSGGWKGRIVDQVSPGGIPAEYLIDGSTGRILASPQQLRGEQLAAKIEQVLSAEEFSKPGVLRR